MTARDGKRRDAGFTRRLVLATTLQGAALAALGFRLYSLQVPRQAAHLNTSAHNALSGTCAQCCGFACASVMNTTIPPAINLSARVLRVLVRL